MLLQIFEEEKVHHILTIGEYPFYLLPLDEDVLSFELDLAYKVYKISLICSIILGPKTLFTFCCGYCRSAMLMATKVRFGILQKLFISWRNVCIGFLISCVLQVDMVTPMCFQLTYEGLLDEVSLRRFGTPLSWRYKSTTLLV
ncbi:hypothetical protein BHE74_00045604 [Ensete ventricosum]|nr:hypothetical protein GW17_00020700 [Ensete ventricosum]RWW48324.1 hypothetical protein BHE74_00045604 [Ensete ventricosum]